MTGIGNETQVRMIADQVAEAAIVKFVQQHPMPEPKAEVPAPLKWAGVIISAVMTAGVVALAIWMVTTLSDLQQTVTRIDERQKLNGDSVTQRLDGLDQRVTRLEGFHQRPMGSE